MHRRAFLAAATGATTAATAGCGDVLGGDAGPEHDVDMASNRFVPTEYRVAVGETVRWANGSTQGHTVTAYEGGLPEGADFFASGGYDDEEAAREAFWDGERAGVLYTGDTFEHTFSTPGTHNYFCIPHERAGMVGRVVVEE